MEEMFSNPFWHALKTEHAGLALGAGAALRYPADVIPFAALQDDSPDSLHALVHLLAPGESIYVTGEHLPEVSGLLHMGQLPGWQMHFNRKTPASETVDISVCTLGEQDAASMVALTRVAFPGFFRTRTYMLGSYFGIHMQGELVAMAGERVALPGYREISAVCTHPAHVGQGYAAILIRHLLRVHEVAELHSFLHVTAANHRAIDLYQRLGFTKTRPILFNQLRRPE